jgi:hypothetical protein
MKKVFTQALLAVCVVMVVGLAACTKEDLSLIKQFDGVEYSLPAADKTYTTYEYEIRKEEWVAFLDKNNIKFDVSKIKSVNLDGYTLTLPDDGSLKNFDNYEFGDLNFIKPGSTEEIKVAFYDATNGNIPAGSTTVAFTSQYTELKEFLTYDKFTVRVHLFTKPNTPAAKVKGNLSAKLVIKPE